MAIHLGGFGDPLDDAATRACSDIANGMDPSEAIQRASDVSGFPEVEVEEAVALACGNLSDLPEATPILDEDASEAGEFLDRHGTKILVGAAVVGGGLLLLS